LSISRLAGLERFMVETRRCRFRAIQSYTQKLFAMMTNSFAHHIPQLTTERLLLRGFGPDDFERYAEMMADPDATRHLGDGRPLSRVEAWRQLVLLKPALPSSVKK
jgi:RimJ/RimL family protein N-acetyltransferase